MKTENSKNKSIWPATTEINSYQQLNKDINVDVLVVGGGMAGILCAYRLKEDGLDVAICEAHEIGMGVTKNTTAVVCAQHDVLYQDMIRNVGKKRAKGYLESNLEAVREFEKLAQKFDFDYQKSDSCIYSRNNLKVIEDEIKALESLDYEAKMVNTIELPIKIAGGVVFPDQGEMNPLKLIKALAQQLTIYECTPIIKIKNNIAYTEKHKIKAQKIVICTHFPIVNNLLYSFRMYQRRSYVACIKCKDKIKGTYMDTIDKGLYIRGYQDMMIIGAGDTRTGMKGEYYRKVYDFINEYYEDAKIINHWGNQDLVTLDDIPYIGKAISCTSDIYLATGFNLWGMTSSMISSMIISDLIQGKTNQYAYVFKPHRSMFKKTLLGNMKIILTKRFNFKKVRCTHLGCSLVQNHEERSWDCACHGSRYSADGTVINEPAKKDLN